MVPSIICKNLLLFWALRAGVLHSFWCRPVGHIKIKPTKLERNLTTLPIVWFFIIYYDLIIFVCNNLVLHFYPLLVCLKVDSYIQLSICKSILLSKSKLYLLSLYWSKLRFKTFAYYIVNNNICIKYPDRDIFMYKSKH